MALAAQATEGELYRPVLGANPAHPSGWPVRVIVSSQTEARHNRGLWAPTHLISIRAPATRLLSMIELPPERHLELFSAMPRTRTRPTRRALRRSTRHSPSSTGCPQMRIF